MSWNTKRAKLFFEAAPVSFQDGMETSERDVGRKVTEASLSMFAGEMTDALSSIFCSTLTFIC